MRVFILFNKQAKCIHKMFGERMNWWVNEWYDSWMRDRNDICTTERNREKAKTNRDRIGKWWWIFFQAFFLFFFSTFIERLFPLWTNVYVMWSSFPFVLFYSTMRRDTVERSTTTTKNDVEKKEEWWLNKLLEKRIILMAEGGEQTRKRGMTKKQKERQEERSEIRKAKKKKKTCTTLLTGPQTPCM